MATEQEKSKMISIKEFKMWLQGVEEMQPEGWVPDARQWERIRAKIDQIDDVVATSPVYTGIRSGEAMLPPGANLAFPPMNTTPPGAANGSMPPPPSGLHVAAPVRQPRATATPSGMPVAITGAAAQPVKTPDVDTSNGKPYNSSFA